MQGSSECSFFGPCKVVIEIPDSRVSEGRYRDITECSAGQIVNLI